MKWCPVRAWSCAQVSSHAPIAGLKHSDPAHLFDPEEPEVCEETPDNCCPRLLILRHYFQEQDGELPRLGLLALACSDGKLHLIR